MSEQSDGADAWEAYLGFPRRRVVLPVPRVW